MKTYFLFFGLLLNFVIIISGQSSGGNSSDFPTLQSDWSYCYEFTWFGPDYDNITMYNGTCADYLEETRADGVPCAAPIVITYDGTSPDMDYLWDNYRSSILCKRSKNQVCVKYTYYYNNQVNNVTHMCAKVQSLNTNSEITNGCYRQTVGGYDTEVCVCKSGPGIYRPCNEASTYVLSLGLAISFITLQVINNVL